MFPADDDFNGSSGTVLFCSAFSLLRSLETSQLRGGPTVTLAMHTYSLASLKWQLVITSEYTWKAQGLSQIMMFIGRHQCCYYV